jgi:hypothetical protein
VTVLSSIRAVVIGDGHLTKTKSGAWLRISHAQDQRDYLHWKASLIGLQGRCEERTYTPKLSARQKQTSFTFRWKSRSEWLSFYQEFYSEGTTKRIKATSVEALSDFELAIWFGDDGSLDKRGDKHCPNAKFCVGVQSTTEAEQIREILDCRFRGVSLIRTPNDKGYHFKLNAIATQRLASITNPILADPLPQKYIKPPPPESRTNFRVST